MNEDLRVLGWQTIRELETERGILASGREEIYGCIFGRDSLITALKLLRSFERKGDAYILEIVKKVLINLAELQGTETNIESGEERGKIVHEYRDKNHERLTAREHEPWYIYQDGTMRNFDSVDSTPLFLMTVSRYISLSKDEDFYEAIMPSVKAALSWLLETSNCHDNGFLSYAFSFERKFGGLVTQSWMDSAESVFHENGSTTPYPIAPVEVQAYAYAAMRAWSKLLLKGDVHLSNILDKSADRLKTRFNMHFVKDKHRFEIAFAIDGNGKPMFSARSSIGHILWSARDENLDCILEPMYVPKLVSLMLSPELFEPAAGIRTLSKRSRKYDPNSYHNGSIWPHDTAIAAEGLAKFGYIPEAERVRDSLRNSWSHFGTPIELFVYTDRGFAEYVSPFGQKACAKQAWSAASMLSEL